MDKSTEILMQEIKRNLEEIAARDKLIKAAIKPEQGDETHGETRTNSSRRDFHK